MYININTHSYYSLLESTLSINDIILFAKNNNQKYVFLTDSNLYGSIEFYNKAIENNLIPIIGLDILYNNQKIIIFPTSNIGYKNLIKISSDNLQNKIFDINNYLEDILIIFNGNKINNINPKYFFTTDINSHTYININECRYKNDEDSIMINIMHAIKFEEKIDLDIKNNISQKLFSVIEFEKEYKKKSNIKNHEEFIRLVSWKKEKQNNDIISFPIEENISSKDYLKKLCEKSLLQKFSKNKNFAVYKDRLIYELNVIDEMGFNDYFLIVHDFILEAKNRDILTGPGRGSSSGSLVSFLLEITKIDPIKYGLIFERFLNPSRYSLPDIDIDIMDNKRKEIIDYIFNKYGYNHVAHIITFQRIKAKMAIRDIGRILDIDLKIINMISKNIPIEYENDLFLAIEKNKELKNFYEKFPDLFNYANKLIGVPRQTGIHAAGIVLSKEELTNIVPIQSGTNDLTTTQVSMEYLESLGLLKIDLLGLSNLTIIHYVIKLIEKYLKLEINLDSLPLDDKMIFNEISNGNTIGIFQLESPGMKNTLRKIKPRNLEDISLVSALFRPGPQKNIPIFTERRFSNKKIDYIDDRIKDLLEPTYGIIVYQEQVINIAQRVANFSLSDSDIFRNSMSKKDPNQMESVKNKFITSAIQNNFSKEVSENIFNYIEKFASYGFNHCHSISYALISYWMVYLKIHFSIYFMSVLLKYSENSHDKIYQYCKESIRMNLKINKPDINISHKSFIIKNNIIFFGFATIKGIGNETAKKIIRIREELGNKLFNDFEQCIAFLYNGGIGESTLETLIYSGSFDSLQRTKKFMINNLKEAIDVSKNMTNDKEYLFSPKWIDVDETEEDIEFFSKKQEDLIGFNFNLNVDNKYSDLINKYSDLNIINLAEINSSEEGNVFTTLIKILDVNTTLTKFGKEMAFIKVIDNQTTDKLVCFNFNNLKDKIIKSQYVIAKIKSSSKGNQLIDIKEIIKDE